MLMLARFPGDGIGSQYPRRSPTNIVMKRTLRRLLLPVRYRGLDTHDVLLASYPRSGITWLRFLLFEITTGRPAEFEPVYQAIPYVGRHHGAAALLPSNGRLVKTHERYRGKADRVIYLVRDARDVLLSERRAALRAGESPRSLDSFVAAWLEGKTNSFGKWVEHVRYWLAQNSSERGPMIIVRFEDVRANPQQTLPALLDFLQVEPMASISSALEHNSAEKMREKEALAPHRFRKVDPNIPYVGTGSVEGWRIRLTDLQTQIIERAVGDVLEVLGYSTARKESGGAG
jgi:hypothetical protein